MIVLDASALIALLGPSDLLHDRAVNEFTRLGAARYGISPITHAEVLVGPVRAGTLERTRTAITTLGVEELPLPADAASELAGLRATTSLKLSDCCVVLAARQSAGAILTFDDRLAATARRLAIPVSSPVA